MFTKIIYTFFFLVAISFNAQSKTGIQFQTKNLEEAKKLAQQENKLIFIDLYTTWCGPCKLMKKNTFPNPELGEFFNKNFISLYIDAEKEGTELAKKFKIVNYPSFLFLDQNGELVQYEYGYYNAAQFLNIGQSVTEKRNSSVGLNKTFPLFLLSTVSISFCFFIFASLNLESELALASFS